MATIIIKDKNLVPENIKDGVTILKVTGTYEGGGGAEISNQDKTVSSSTSDQTVMCDSGYTGLGTVTVNKYTLDSKTVDASTVQQVVTSSADGLSSVTVKAVDASIDSNILPQNIKKNVTILGVTGTMEGGVLTSLIMSPSTGTVTKYPDTTQHIYGFESVTFNAVTSSIDPNITSENIKAGVTILGVTGNYVGDSVEINNQKKSVTPRRTLQTVTNDAGYTGMDEVTVYGVDSSIDSNITPSNIKSGVNILGVTGNYTGSSGGSAYVQRTYHNEMPEQTVFIFGNQNGRWNNDGVSDGGYMIDGNYGQGQALVFSIKMGPLNQQYPQPSQASYHISTMYTGEMLNFFVINNNRSEYYDYGDTTAQGLFTLSTYGESTLSLDGVNFSSSVDITNKATPVYINGGCYVILNEEYNGNTWSQTIIWCDEMPPMPDEPEPVTCYNCEGTGVDPNTGETCDVCGGSGEIW